MLTGKLVSCKTVVDAVYGDAGIEVNIEEAVRWVGRTLDFIGCPAILKTIVTNGLADEDGIIHSPIPVVAYRAALPLSLSSIISCANYETKQMMYEMTDSLYKSYGDSTYPNTLQENSYVTNNNYIFTGFETGYLELCYEDYSVDSEGYPKVPEDEKILEALKWTIIKNLDYLGWRSGRISDAIYRESNKQYNWYIGAATNRANYGTNGSDKLESWMRARIQLLPRLKMHSVAFRQPAKDVYQKNPNFVSRLSVVGDTQSVLLNLQLYGVDGSNSTNNVLYWNFLNSTNTRTLNIYSNAAKTSGYLVAHATGEILDGNMLLLSISEDNSSGISGTLTVNIPTLGATDDTDSSNMIVFYNV